MKNESPIVHISSLQVGKPAAWIMPLVETPDVLMEELFSIPLEKANEQFEREYLVRLLARTKGCITAAARIAGRNRTEFYKLLDRHALQYWEFR